MTDTNTTEERCMIECMKKNPAKMPFNCPYLLVVSKGMKRGGTPFEEGDMLCTNGFLDVCCIFSRAKADENGNIIAQCRKTQEELVIVLREEG
jgi:hypothetical protein